MQYPNVSKMSKKPSDQVLSDIKITDQLNLGHEAVSLRLGQDDEGRLVMRMQKINYPCNMLEMYLDVSTLIMLQNWIKGEGNG